jgi:hypothetical protein
LNKQSEWVFGIGDPTVFGWITVGSYALSAFLCWRTSRRAAGRDKEGWLLIVITLVMLGVNKQLDIQSLFAQEAGRVLQVMGMYAERRFLQRVFIVSLMLTLLSTGIFLSFRFARENVQLKLAFAGFFLLMLFVASRAAVFHRVYKMPLAYFGGVPLNFLFENGGLALIAIGAWLRRERLRRSVIAVQAGSIQMGSM